MVQVILMVPLTVWINIFVPCEHMGIRIVHHKHAVGAALTECASTESLSHLRHNTFGIKSSKTPEAKGVSPSEECVLTGGFELKEPDEGSEYSRVPKILNTSMKVLEMSIRPKTNKCRIVAPEAGLINDIKSNISGTANIVDHTMRPGASDADNLHKLEVVVRDAGRHISGSAGAPDGGSILPSHEDISPQISEISGLTVGTGTNSDGIVDVEKVIGNASLTGKLAMVSSSHVPSVLSKTHPRVSSAPSPARLLTSDVPTAPPTHIPIDTNIGMDDQLSGPPSTLSSFDHGFTDVDSNFVARGPNSGHATPISKADFDEDEYDVGVRRPRYGGDESPDHETRISVSYLISEGLFMMTHFTLLIDGNQERGVS
jgi:hypothetical protein